ncbi:DUF4430 domain-containing protein [Sporosarcina sp. GW1-11]|uniref:DUF4430 domain-containing protein n=1 Tax=Sporosarcina sp. GW1-11 TaxID=2899126 RepID=UPI00294F0C9A|nr:DUF4430 domain-containing protein [Sporosarcina sp. GW1-11]MDV6379121.1 DUF4430 domain-containing protein [Sporosarcina sp. GW1-11]
MVKRYVSFIASIFLASSLLLPTTTSVAIASSDAQQQMAIAQQNIAVEVVGLDDVLLQETIQITEGQNALEALKMALDAKGIVYKITESSFGSYVSSINNEDAGLLGGWDGWGYTVNGVSPNIGAASYVLKENDQLRFSYGRYAAFSSSTVVTAGSKNPNITVNLVGDTFTQEASNPANWSINQSNVKISTITKNTNQQVTIQLDGAAQRGDFTLTALDGVVVGKSEPAASLTVTVEADPKRIENSIKKVTDYIVSSPVSSEWQAIGLVKAGVAVPSSYETAFTTNLKDQVIDQIGGNRLKITDVERLTMAAVAIGKDPANINGANLLDKIYNSEDIRNVDTMIRQGTNGLIFALIALDTNNFDIPSNARWNREKIVAELLKYQREDGAWSLETSKTGSASYDITAMAMTSLAPYTNQADVKSAIDRAVNYLSAQQGETGGFNEAFVGGISSEATSQVIIGLTANAIDPQGKQFTKNGVNLVDHLLSFQLESGGFKHTENETAANGMATEQALQALVAYDLFTKDQGRLYDFSQKQTQPQPEVSAHSTLKGILNGSLLNVQKNKNGAWSSILIENEEALGGYYIVQAGEKGSKQSATIPEGTKKIFLVDNDQVYRDFDAKIVAPSHPFTVTFNKEVQNTTVNLSKIYVEDVQGQRVPVNVSVKGNRATVTPQTNYTSGQLYSLVISDLVSTDGKPLKQAARKLFIIQ